MATAFPKTITISNPEGSKYTSYRRALELVSRGHAVFSTATEITLTERGIGVRPAQPGDPVTGSFAWYVGNSGYCGPRVMMAEHV